VKIADKFAVACVVFIAYGCLLVDVIGPNSYSVCFIFSGVIGLIVYVPYTVLAGL
jgi:hypothetical protein